MSEKLDPITDEDFGPDPLQARFIKDISESVREHHQAERMLAEQREWKREQEEVSVPEFGPCESDAAEQPDYQRFLDLDPVATAKGIYGQIYAQGGSQLREELATGNAETVDAIKSNILAGIVASNLTTLKLLESVIATYIGSSKRADIEEAVGMFLPKKMAVEQHLIAALAAMNQTKSPLPGVSVNQTKVLLQQFNQFLSNSEGGADETQEFD